jgi:hypothetical protein
MSEMRYITRSLDLVIAGSLDGFFTLSPLLPSLIWFRGTAPIAVGRHLSPYVYTSFNDTNSRSNVQNEPRAIYAADPSSKFRCQDV